MDPEYIERIQNTPMCKIDPDAECLQCLWIDKTLKRLKREKEASQGLTKSKHRHRHFRFLPKVKRFPFLSDLQYANFALALYEKQPHAQGTKFEVVEVLGVCRALMRFHLMAELPRLDPGVGDCCHVSLFARPRGHDDASTYFFFFEFLDCGSGEFQLVTLNKSKPEEVSDLTCGCGLCPVGKEYPHPGTIVGGLESVPLDPASQREMARCFKSQLIRNRHTTIKPKRFNISH